MSNVSLLQQIQRNSFSVFFFGRKMSEMLNLPVESGEKWIVNLIRNARLDAKIDAKTVSFLKHSPCKSVNRDYKKTDILVLCFSFPLLSELGCDGNAAAICLPASHRTDQGHVFPNERAD